MKWYREWKRNRPKARIARLEKIIKDNHLVVDSGGAYYGLASLIYGDRGYNPKRIDERVDSLAKEVRAIERCMGIKRTYQKHDVNFKKKKVKAEKVEEKPNE